MYSALELSQYIVTKCIRDRKPISNLQLQKILYYIQKDFLRRNIVAFPDNIESWRFGPAIADVYYYFCGYGAMEISAEYEDIAIDDRTVDHIVEEKRELYPWDMVNETHKTNGAWFLTYQQGIGERCIIPIELIKSNG